MSATYENQALHYTGCIKAKKFFYWIDVVYITPLQTVHAAEQESDSALMVIRKVIRYVPYREKPCVHSESSTLRFKIGSDVTFCLIYRFSSFEQNNLNTFSDFQQEYWQMIG